ncbi:MAG: hypothetical protein SFU86_00980 [Pirellulaceae bacterium]|nr:hypothetical protein [Pirellulaceae bacterium]
MRLAPLCLLTAAIVTVPLLGSFALAQSTMSAQPATPEQAARVIDLRQFPLPAGVQPSIRTLSTLLYDTTSTPKAAYAVVRGELLKRGFQEQPGYASADTVMALFTKEGFRVTASANTTGEPGQASVSVVNDGNVDLAKLPVPPGVKPFHPQPTEASYTTTATIPETAAACRKLILAAGWEPFGEAGDTRQEMVMQYFKRNAIQLQLWVMKTPAEGGKTLIRYGTELLQVDFPLPPGAKQLDYTDAHKTLRFEMVGHDTAAIFAFYRERLGKLGWQPTTDKPITDDSRGTAFLVFRNAAKELISLDLDVSDESVAVKLLHQTAAELAEEERLAKAHAEKQKLAEAERNRKFKVVVPLPAKAADLEKPRENVIEFTLPTGSGPAALSALRDHFVKEGWTEQEGAELGKNSGDLDLKKDKLELDLSYFDIGFTPAEIRVSGSFNVTLETTTSQEAPAAKLPAEAPPVAKPTLPAIPGLPALPPGLELPPEAKALLEKALQDAAGKKPAGKK